MSSPFTRPPQIAFYDAADGRRLAARIWETAGAPRAHAVFLHGISSHGGWYTRSCEHLARAGFAVHFLDRRGSGLNQHEPGDIDRLQTWIDDVEAYLRQLQRSRPIALCGISWGGKLVTAIARRHPGLFDGLALICPGLYSPFDPGPLKRTLLTLPTPRRLARRRMPIPLRKSELFTDSPTWRDFIAHDPFTLREVTWRFARESARLTHYAQQSATFIHMPTLVMLAGRDRIVHRRRTDRFYDRIASTRKALFEYPNAAHTLEFESDPQPYFDDLATWLGRIAGCGPCC
jgi:alpha-beta hydrolase superfamily lysophospholipase